MRNPNGFGSVVKLPGKRRRPYAARISSIEEGEDGSFRQKFKYLGYFEKRKEAMEYLSGYNSGTVTKKREGMENLPTFSEIYDKYLEDWKLLNEPGASAVRQRGYAFNRMKQFHDRKFQNITLDELQKMFLDGQEMSQSTQKAMLSTLRGMYSYAVKRDIVEKDISKFIRIKFTLAKTPAHTVLTDEEIQTLWEYEDYPYVYVALIMVYTGLRASEFLGIRTENIHLADRYLVGGMKSKAGFNRTIPIAEKIAPFFEKYLDESKEYFFNYRKQKSPLAYSSFRTDVWPNVQNIIGNHTSHDCRHTCATLMKRAGVDDLHRKKILGHAIYDITDRVYTAVTIEELIKDINLI